jgi:hypothetical protein
MRRALFVVQCLWLAHLRLAVPVTQRRVIVPDVWMTEFGANLGLLNRGAVGATATAVLRISPPS